MNIIALDLRSDGFIPEWKVKRYFHHGKMRLALGHIRLDHDVQHPVVELRVRVGRRGGGLAEAHPAIELTLVMGEPEETEPQLKSGDLDLAIGFGSRMSQDDGVECRSMCS